LLGNPRQIQGETYQGYGRVISFLVGKDEPFAHAPAFGAEKPGSVVVMAIGYGLGLSGIADYVKNNLRFRKSHERLFKELRQAQKGVKAGALGGNLNFVLSNNGIFFFTATGEANGNRNTYQTYR
jgi:hypothetical protein